MGTRLLPHDASRGELSALLTPVHLPHCWFSSPAWVRTAGCRDCKRVGRDGHVCPPSRRLWMAARSCTRCMAG
jgi:hypothetical protein